MTSVKFNGTEICNSSYIPRYVKHESAPERDVSVLQLAREDGAVFISEKYGSKTIIVSGKLTATSRENLENAIDNFKSLFADEEKNLDISWNDTTRRYVATCISHNFDRDYFHDLFVPWTAQFLVSSGIGKDTTETEALDGVSANPKYTGSVSFSGSAKPLPSIKLTFGTNWSNAYGIKFENTDKEEEIIVNYSDGFSDGDELIIDCENKTVTINDEEIPFYRVFPTFDIGSNNIEISAGDIIDQIFDCAGKTFYTGSATYNEAWGNDYVAQSFSVPRTDETYQGLTLFLRKPVGTGADNGVLEIQTDSDGAPSGVAVSDAEFVITNGDITESSDFGGGAWLTVNSSNKFTLSANTLYWIVLKINGDSEDTYIIWDRIQGSEATYGRGFAARTTDGGTNWTNIVNADRPFKLLFGGKADSPAGNLTLDIDYFKRWL
jgi:phage-related protein